MAEQTQVETETSEQTLDDVYKEFNVEEVAQSFNAQPQAAPQPAPRPNIPDPALDIDGFKGWAENVQTSDAELRQSFRQVSEQLSSINEERQRQVEETDLNAAVKIIQEGEPALEGKEKLVKSYLGTLANDDKKLVQVWQNRGSNPKAWNAALRAVKSQIAKDFSFSADPQLTENVRAMKTSRDQMATTTKVDPNDEWSGSITDFERKWSQLTNG